MPNIDASNAANSQTSCEYWQDELKNSRILLYNVNIAIKTLLSGTHQSYTIDTGQTKQTVTRLDINNLMMQRENLLSQIADLELHPCNKTRNATKQVRPYW